jgi:hypothetical protein
VSRARRIVLVELSAKKYYSKGGQSLSATDVLSGKFVADPSGASKAYDKARGDSCTKVGCWPQRAQLARCTLPTKVKRRCAFTPCCGRSVRVAQGPTKLSLERATIHDRPYHCRCRRLS